MWNERILAARFIYLTYSGIVDGHLRWTTRAGQHENLRSRGSGGGGGGGVLALDPGIILAQQLVVRGRLAIIAVELLRARTTDAPVIRLVRVEGAGYAFRLVAEYGPG